MKVLIVGDKRRYDELLLKLPKEVSSRYFSFWEAVDSDKYDLVFDLNFDDFPRHLEYFARLEIPVIAGAVKKPLAEAAHEYGDEVRCTLIGMNTLPGFINREMMEISLFQNNREPADKLLQQLNWKYRVVEDRAGMITPRIICMIINEASYTLQEGTASIRDIDLAMKLGTNYPLGPFEWADKIGIKDVYETLEAISLDTRDERYKICPLLKGKYLKAEGFYK